MKMQSILKGVATAAVIGTAVYMFGNSSSATKKKIKKSTGKAINSIGDTLSNF